MRFGMFMIAIIALILVTLTCGKSMRRVSFENALRDCDSGDLVLFRHREFSVTRAISHFTHVGIVHVKDGAKYIVETHARGDVKGQDAGVHIYDLAKRIREYQGTVALARLKTPLSASQRARFNVQKYLDIPFYQGYAAHFVTHCLVLPSRPSRSAKTSPGMFCSEFIGRVQKDIGIRAGHARDDCMTPDNLADQESYRAARIIQ